MKPLKLNNQIIFEHGCTLFIGRKRQVITQPARFEMLREHEQFDFTGTGTVDYIPDLPSREVYSLFIAGNLFATTKPSRRRRGSVVIKRLKGGKVELHLTKKYTTLS